MISVVLYGRNDSYGYNLHKRAAISLNCIAEILTDPQDEIIFVDYNTPDDFPTFPEAIADTLTERARSLLRILRVRPHHHERFRAKTHLVCLEPIARNAGIRRSNPVNRWVLSTNTDMVFVPRRQRSLSEIAATLPDAYYHLARFEVPETLWESVDRLNPHGIIESFRGWGRDLHLNEIVYTSHPDVKYDGPGDFQLILRADLWRMQGFHEGMLLGWHVDSNTARRLSLLPQAIGDLIDDLYGYHCDHTRQVTPAHRANAAQNDQRIFHELVKSAQIPEQAENWGFANEPIEELNLTSPSRKYIAALSSTIARPLETPTTTGYFPNSFNHMDYVAEHVVPFLADSLSSYPRDTVVGWIGAKRSLLEHFVRVWKAMDFSQPILVLNEAPWLRSSLSKDCTWTEWNEVRKRADIFVFDWGKPEDGGPLESWVFERDPIIQEITSLFRRAVRDERLRIREGSTDRRRFIGVNAICNAVEGVFNNNINAALTPLATHIRQGFLNAHVLDETTELLSSLHAGKAGQRVPSGILAVPGVDGDVFYGPYLDLDADTYRITIELADVRITPAESPFVALQVVSNERLLAYHELSRTELIAGRVVLDFPVTEKLSSAGEWPLIEFRLKTDGVAGFTVCSAVLDVVKRAGAGHLLREFDALRLLTAGPAGRRDGAGIAAQRGIADLVAYGPYLWLEPGRYEATFFFEVAGPVRGATIRAYVASHLGQRVLAETSVQPKSSGRLRCALTFDLTDEPPTRETGLLEFLVWSDGRLGFSLTAAHVKYLSPIPATEGSQTTGVMPVLHVGPAGRRTLGTISASYEAAGVVFFGPYIDLSPGRHRLEIRLRGRSAKNDPGLTIAVVSGGYLLGQHEVDRSEIDREICAFEFEVADEKLGRNVECVLRTTGRSDVTVRSVIFSTVSGAASFPQVHDIEILKLLEIGPGGKWAAAPASHKSAIRNVPHVDGTVAYGPYLALEPGSYEASFQFLVERGLRLPSIDIDAACDLGRRVLAAKTVRPNRRGLLKRIMFQRWALLEDSLEFVVPEGVSAEDRYEFRVRATGKAGLFLSGLRLRKRTA